MSAAPLPSDLLRAATEALARALAHPTAARAGAEAEIAAIYGERITRDLTGSEARLLESITDTRERGLALCRAGRIHAGGALIARARATLTRADIGREAFVLSDSFLCAGEGFVHFKSDRPDAAVSSMIEAIDRCRELRDAWGYPVEGRRIHLACNAARVRAEAARHEESSVVLAQLVNLIATSDRRFWPYPDLEYLSGPDPLGDDARWELLDQVLTAVSRLAPEALGRVTAALPSDPPGHEPHPLVTRARCFTEAIRAHASEDFEAFLSHCTDFPPPAPHHLPRASRHLVERLLTGMPSSERRIRGEPGR
ncbi:hypothetical protein [Streptomyces anandii]|uniref:hypothetical protein n=1 Tax=Streptomyces anandii TaxID=285454 RepID=UPI00379B7C6F